jgi:hypothetical protein
MCPKMLPKDTKQALETFLSNNVDKLSVRKWGLAEKMYREFIGQGHTISILYFKASLTKYRRQHGIKLINNENKYYKPRPSTV